MARRRPSADAIPRGTKREDAPTSFVPPAFTDHQVDKIKQTLPKNVDRERLAFVLREWACAELSEHLSHEPPATTRMRRDRLKTVARRATDLENILSALDEHDRIMVALEMAKSPGADLSGVFETQMFSELRKRLGEEADFLRHLSAAAPKATGPTARGRPRDLTAYRVMLDLAAIYEHLTDLGATRVVDRHTGKESSPFWRFCSAVWPLVFPSGAYSLATAMKFWESARIKFNDLSPVIINLRLRRPVWMKS